MNLIKRLIRDERGGEVLEYAMILGLIVVAAMAVMSYVLADMPERLPRDAR